MCIGGPLRRYLLGFCMLCAAVHSYCQDTDQITYTSSDILIATGISAGVQAASIFEAFLYEESCFPALLLGTTALQHVPQYWIDPGNALIDSCTTVGLGGLYFLQSATWNNGMLNALLVNSAHKYSMFSTYEIYRNMRSRAADEIYRASFHPYSLPELLVAPFDPSNLSRWYVWGPLAVMAGIYIAGDILDAGGNALWDTGSVYIGSDRVDPLLGLPLMLLAQIVSFTFTGVGEESLYRGVYYEEMRTSWGEWPAKITDALSFTFSHFPQQFSQLTLENAPGFALQTLLSIGLTIWYQYVYEWGGLPAIVALHAWGDVIGFYTGWLLKAGNPNTEGTGFSINTRGLSIGFEAQF